MKIKDCSIEQLIDLLFNKLAKYTGVKYNSQEEREIAAADLIEMLLKGFPEKFVNEIVGAYYLADQKKLFDPSTGEVMMVFRILDYRQCSDFIHKFDEYFKKSFEQELKSQRFFYDRELNVKKEIDQKKMYESFKRSLQIALDMVAEGREFSLPGSDIFIYDTLKDLGVINLSQEEKEFEINTAYNDLKVKWNAERVTGASIGRRMELGKMIEDLMPEDIRVLNQAKRNFLAKQLKIWVEFGSTVEEIIS